MTWFFKSTLPDSNDMPSGFSQEPTYSSISSLIVNYLLAPKLLVGLWCSCILTIIMAVPKTTVDEYDSARGFDYKIRFAGKCFDISAIPYL